MCKKKKIKCVTQIPLIMANSKEQIYRYMILSKEMFMCDMKVLNSIFRSFEQCQFFLELVIFQGPNIYLQQKYLSRRNIDVKNENFSTFWSKVIKMVKVFKE